MEFPLSNLEAKRMHEVCGILEREKSHVFEGAEFLKYKEWLTLLNEHGYTLMGPYDNGKICTRKSSTAGFIEWAEDQNSKAKKWKRREWTIALVSALVGSVTTVIIQILL